MIKIAVPASSGNCCVGFDVLGLALNLYNHFEFYPGRKGDDSNLALHSFRYTASYFGKEQPLMDVWISGDVPIARGLGSSSTCIVAGIMAANAYYDLRLDKADILKLASIMEGHPDNVAPAIYGGLCLSKQEGNEVTASEIEIADYSFLAMVPDYEVKTEMARAILPYDYPKGNVVKELYYAMSFLLALQKGEEEQLCKACVDLIHEPYRKELIKDYAALKKRSEELILPFWISGSGSTLLACSKKDEKLKEMEDFAKTLGLRVYRLKKDPSGAYYE